MAVVLGLDTSDRTTHAAIADGDSILAEVSVQELGRAENLLILLEQLFEQTNFTTADLGCIAVATGPGSFTGIRTGLATAQGLGSALNLPVVGVSILLARTRLLLDTSQSVVALLTASATESYCASFAKESDGRVIFALGSSGVIPLSEIEEFDSAFSRLVDYPGELFSEGHPRPAGLVALTAARGIAGEDFSGTGEHYQHTNKGIGLKALYIKGASARTLKERQSKREGQH